jgi:hypothetical protein
MNETGISHCLVLLSDQAFSVRTKTPISNEMKNEFLRGALPQGSKWRNYAGMRSISFFSLKALSKLYALSYSIITSNIVTPIVSFIILLDKERAEIVVTRQISDIENAFLREIDIFTSLDKDSAELLRENLIYYKSLDQQLVDLRRPERINAGNQTVFISKYDNRLQWKIVESMILEKSTTPLLSFRTFALQRELNFQVIGVELSEDNNNLTQSSNSNRKTLRIISVLILILGIFICSSVLLLVLRSSQ